MYLQVPLQKQQGKERSTVFSQGFWWFWMTINAEYTLISQPMSNSSWLQAAFASGGESMQLLTVLWWVIILFHDAISFCSWWFPHVFAHCCIIRFYHGLICCKNLFLAQCCCFVWVASTHVSCSIKRVILAIALMRDPGYWQVVLKWQSKVLGNTNIKSCFPWNLYSAGPGRHTPLCIKVPFLCVFYNGMAQ